MSNLPPLPATYEIRYAADLSRREPPKINFYQYAATAAIKEKNSKRQVQQEVDQFLSSTCPHAQRVLVADENASLKDYLIIQQEEAAKAEQTSHPSEKRKPEHVILDYDTLTRSGVIQGEAKDPVLTVRHADGQILNLPEIQKRLLGASPRKQPQTTLHPEAKTKAEPNATPNKPLSWLELFEQKSLPVFKSRKEKVERENELVFDMDL
ncbi:hypothetical protein [Vampirovibrio sp.]|uniref:hypothetical protein n=1 Tax=Vampirovibrio sp. TaxID=2717857 RepID=UPI003592F86B